MFTLVPASQSQKFLFCRVERVPNVPSIVLHNGWPKRFYYRYRAAGDVPRDSDIADTLLGQTGKGGGWEKLTLQKFQTTRIMQFPTIDPHRHRTSLKYSNSDQFFNNAFLTGTIFFIEIINLSLRVGKRVTWRSSDYQWLRKPQTGNCASSMMFLIILDTSWKCDLSVCRN